MIGEVWVKKSSGIEVEAVRLNEENIEEVSKWCHADMIEETDPENPGEMRFRLNVNTPHGMQNASLNMYVIKFGRQFFTSHNRPFEMTYEPKNRPAPPLESAADSRRERGFADPFDRGRYQ